MWYTIQYSTEQNFTKAQMRSTGEDWASSTKALPEKVTMINSHLISHRLTLTIVLIFTIVTNLNELT